MIGRVGSVWRVHVRHDRRGQGIGRAPNAVMGAEARALGYERPCRRAAEDAQATLRYWQASGYDPFARFGESLPFDKAT